jgi:tetratricopeptide (TPR) repeat protein
MALLMPLLLLAVVEILLRLSGYGFPTGFFLKQRVNGREVLTDNWQFGWRFFPKEIARTPQPVVFSARKEPGTIRIFVLGESAAMGDPEPAFGLPRMIQAMLELRFPSNRFEVINVAMTAINSHVIREIAKDCVPQEADVWVVYMGNNEVVGPFGGGTVFGRQVPSFAFIRASLWLKQFRVVQLLGLLRRNRAGEWEGMEMFLKQQVAQDDPRMRTVYSHFRRNLEDIVRMGQNSGARVVLSTVAVNLKDCPPFSSQHSVTPSSTEEADWQRAFDRGVTFELAKDFTAAHKAFRQAQDVTARHGEDHHAAICFHLARCELVLGSNDAARAHFKLARNYDTLRFRADDEINAEIRACASQRTTGIRFVDAENILATQDAHGLPGTNDFYEHVHFTFQGNYRLARALFDEVAATLPASVTNNVRPDFPTASDCARRLVWSDWDRLQVYEEVGKRLQQPPFSSQFGHVERDAQWRKSIAELGDSLTAEKIQQTVVEYQDALKIAPGDWVLRENFAKMLEANSETTAAIEQWKWVAALLPQDITAQYHIGNLLDTLGRSEEALPYFYAALRRNAASVETRNGLALALGNIGRTAEAQRELEGALRLNPKFTEARINLGHLLARQGKIEAAISQYELALKNDTNSAAAHVNLGKLLHQRGDRKEAVGHYEAALRINPKSAVAHLNLGNEFLVANSSEATRHYMEAVRLKPDFAEAHLALALELAKTGNTAEAEKHFADTIRLRPNSADAHFNYGVLLAKENRFTEAAREFTETLKLQPTHPKARQFLERAQQRQ